jgi:hypothetical protein
MASRIGNNTVAGWPRSVSSGKLGIIVTLFSPIHFPALPCRAEAWPVDPRFAVNASRQKRQTAGSASGAGGADMISETECSISPKENNRKAI